MVFSTGSLGRHRSGPPRPALLPLVVSLVLLLLLLLLSASSVAGAPPQRRRLIYRPTGVEFRYRRGEACKFDSELRKHCRVWREGTGSCDVTNNNGCAFEFQTALDTQKPPRVQGGDGVANDGETVRGVVTALYLENITKYKVSSSGLVELRSPSDLWAQYQSEGSMDRPYRHYLIEERGSRYDFAWLETVVHGILPENPGVAPDARGNSDREKVRDEFREETLKSAPLREEL